MFETNHNQNAYRLRELADGLDKLAGLARDLRADMLTPPSSLEAAWQIAPMALRLKFARDILPEDSGLRPALSQASALEDLRQRGEELNTWLSRYPSLFADTIELLTKGRENYNEHLTQESDPAFMLAMNTLDEAYRLLEVDLNRYGVVWISPSPGTLITSDHEIVGEKPSDSHKTTVACVIRRGFSRKGTLELPAQIMRSMGPAAQLPNIPLPPPSPNLSLQGRGTCWPNTRCEPASDAVLTPSAEHRTPSIPVPSPSTAESSLRSARQRTPPNLSLQGRGTSLPNARLAPPDWLRILGQRTQGCEVDEVNEIVRDLHELVDAAQSGLVDSSEDSRTQAASLLAPLVSLLSMRYADGIPGIGEEWGAALLEARDPILLWLRETLSIEPISPQRGDKFDPKLMDAIEDRRTVHANEIDTVARVEKIGLAQADAPVVRAQVVRYVSGRE